MVSLSNHRPQALCPPWFDKLTIRATLAHHWASPLSIGPAGFVEDDFEQGQPALFLGAGFVARRLIGGGPGWGLVRDGLSPHPVCARPECLGADERAGHCPERRVGRMLAPERCVDLCHMHGPTSWLNRFV